MKKYKVSKELMSELLEWQKVVIPEVRYYDYLPIGFSVDGLIYKWFSEANNKYEQHDRLIALINLAYGEDVFEVEKPKKWVVRSKYRIYDAFHFVSLKNAGWSSALQIDDAYVTTTTKNISFAFKFNSKEEAEKWTNPLMEVVEVEDD